jgi:hypothetical protein
MHANKPDMAKEWERKTLKGAKLPEKASKTAAILAKHAVIVSDHSGWRSPLASTVGRVGALQSAAVFRSMSPVTTSSKKENIKELIEEYTEKHEKDLEPATKRRGIINWLLGRREPGEGRGELAVHLGGVGILDTLKRTWTTPGLSLPSRVLGTGMLPVNAAMGALGRMDHYNPYAHSVVSYADEPALQAHELGHAADFSKRDYPALYALLRAVPGGTWFQEWLASKKGMEMMKGAKNRRRERVERGEIAEDDKYTSRYDTARANRVLSGGLGSYVGTTFIPQLGPNAPFLGALLGHAAALGRPFGDLDEEQKEEVIAKARAEVSRTPAILAKHAYGVMEPDFETDRFEEPVLYAPGRPLSSGRPEDKERDRKALLEALSDATRRAKERGSTIRFSAGRDDDWVDADEAAKRLQEKGESPFAYMLEYGKGGRPASAAEHPVFYRTQSGAPAPQASRLLARLLGR